MASGRPRWRGMRGRRPGFSPREGASSADRGDNLGALVEFCTAPRSRALRRRPRLLRTAALGISGRQPTDDSRWPPLARAVAGAGPTTTARCSKPIARGTERSFDVGTRPAPRVGYLMADSQGQRLADAGEPAGLFAIGRGGGRRRSWPGATARSRSPPVCRDAGGGFRDRGVARASRGGGEARAPTRALLRGALRGGGAGDRGARPRGFRGSALRRGHTAGARALQNAFHDCSSAHRRGRRRRDVRRGATRHQRRRGGARWAVTAGAIPVQWRSMT